MLPKLNAGLSVRRLVLTGFLSALPISALIGCDQGTDGSQSRLSKEAESGCARGLGTSIGEHAGDALWPATPPPLPDPAPSVPDVTVPGDDGASDLIEELLGAFL